MLKAFELLVKIDCIFCKNAIELLVAKNIPFVVIVVDKCPEYLEEKKQFYQHQTIPIILKRDDKNNLSLVGGFDELKKFFEQNG